MPKVSILIPTYNVEQYLRRCLDSVVRQTLEDIQIICVNDGSTDGSLAVIKEYAAKDKRFTVIDKANEGYGKAMNVATAAATGEYIGIVEPDDYVAENMYEVLYEKASLNDLDFVKADFFRFSRDDMSGDLIYNYNHLSSDTARYNVIFNPSKELDSLRFIMNTWSGIYRRSFIEENHIVYNETSGASFQDNGFYFQTFVFATRAMILDVPLYRNRRDNPHSSVKSREKVYAMNIEYDYIRRCLVSHPEIWKRTKGWYWVKKYDNYMATLRRIGDEFKAEFIERISHEFKRAIQTDELDMELFRKEERGMIMLLVQNPRAFHVQIRDMVEMPQSGNMALLFENNYLRKQLEELHQSATWRAGRFITFVPRKIKGFMRGR